MRKATNHLMTMSKDLVIDSEMSVEAKYHQIFAIAPLLPGVNQTNQPLSSSSISRRYRITRPLQEKYR
jgi:hypothetical protein